VSKIFSDKIDIHKIATWWPEIRASGPRRRMAAAAAARWASVKVAVAVEAAAVEAVVAAVVAAAAVEAVAAAVVAVEGQWLRPRRSTFFFAAPGIDSMNRFYGHNLSKIFFCFLGCP
jgi:hypothetical protein